jgi:chorismate mutase
MPCRALRGATTVEQDSEEEIRTSTRELLSVLLDENGLDPRAVISAFFTCTPDLHSAFPAQAARELGLHDAALLCAMEIDVRGALPRCIRALLHIETDLRQDELRHVYLREAVTLRPEFARGRGSSD